MGFALRTHEGPVQAATRQHLLEAAGEVFAEVGFRSATVRQICERAGANIAAVNYHFGDKEALYKAVLKVSVQAAMARHPVRTDPAAQSRPELRLRFFIHSFLSRIFSDGPSARHGKLMAREMIEPTSALDEIIRENIRPMSDELISIVSALLGRPSREKTIRLCAMSVVSQVLFYHHCRPMVTRLFPRMTFDAGAIEELTGHITRFSLAAILEMKRTSAG